MRPMSKMGNCVIVPVRSGSKGLCNKNIMTFCGEPLLGYVLNKLSSSKVFDYIIVSSDSLDYLEVANKYGATDLVSRPKSLATDEATTYDVVKHAISQFEKSRNLSIERYFLTQVTSPLWSQNELVKFINKAKTCKSSIVSVCLSKQNPTYNLLQKSKNGYALAEHATHKRRQDHSNVYFINGCFYSFKKEYFLETGWIRDIECEICCMSMLSSIDIDNIEDFKLCELIAKNMELF